MVVVDLTELNDDAETASSKTSSRNGFNRQSQRQQIKHAVTNGGAYGGRALSSSCRPESRGSNFSVVIPSKPPNRPSPACSSGSLKRRRDSENAKTTTSNFPLHHGLSPFFHVQDDPNSGREALYAKQKTSECKATMIPRSGTFRPSHTSSRSSPLLPSPTEKSNDLRNLYIHKLSSISGPKVYLTAKNVTRKAEFNFEFINSYKIQDGVEQVDPNFNGGCDCPIGKCGSTCGCLSVEEDSDERIVPYKRNKDGTIVLRESFMRRKAMIHECSFLCSCSVRCWNRVVSRGRTLELEIFETRDRGFGLRSPTAIQTGQFIDCYRGEIVSKKVADDREKAISALNSSSYLFSLDFFSEDDIYVVDGRKYGSITRFMNHSCNPNCKMFSVSHNHADMKIFELAFFAVRDIPPNTELTFDYQPNWKADELGDVVDPDAVKCLCGEKSCRGQLWPNKRKTTTQQESDSSDDES